LSRTLDRREFTLEAALAVLSGAVSRESSNDDLHTHTVTFN
jgi:hypothetical protein